MGDVVVVEAAEHMYDGVAVADVGEELVAEAFAFGGAANEAGDVDNLDGGGHHARRTLNLDEFGEAFVGDGDDADVGLDGAEWEIGGLCFSVAQAVEERRLAHVGQSYYTTLEAHFS